MVTIIYGAEPWLCDRYREKEIGGMDFVRATSFSSKESQTLKSNLLFGEPSVCLILDDVKGINDKLLDYVADPVKDSNLVIQLKEYDSRSKAFKQLIYSDGIELIECKRYNQKQYTYLLLSRITKAGKKITSENMELLADRIGYLKDDDITLYSVENILDNLINASEDVITAELIGDIVPMRNAVDRFGIAPLISKGEKERVIEKVPEIRKQVGTVAFLNILLREFRIAYKAKFFTRDEIGAASYNFKDWSLERIKKALVDTSDVIKAVTSSLMPEEAALYVLIDNIM